jgi:excisionase family DNA binding protein
MTPSDAHDTGHESTVASAPTEAVMTTMPVSQMDVLSLPIPEELIEQIAARVAELVIASFSRPGANSPWLDFTAASAYLGFSRDKLYKLTAAKAIPFRKKQGGQGLLFHRGELDTWLESRYPREGWPS